MIQAFGNTQGLANYYTKRLNLVSEGNNAFKLVKDSFKIVDFPQQLPDQVKKPLLCHNFLHFIKGFNAGHRLISYTDAGTGKGAADRKIEGMYTQPVHET